MAVGAVDPQVNGGTADPHPAGPDGPTITFSPNADNLVDSRLAGMVESAVVENNSDINISATTNGTHAATSAHYNGRAVDINYVEGEHVGPGNVEAGELQRTFQATGGIRENFGPALNVKTFPDGRVVPLPQVAAAHTGHIHVSVQP
jgi:hypothetical protein